MSTMIRYAPFPHAVRLQDEMNRIFGSALRGWSEDGESLGGAWVPPVDVYEDAEGITLRAEVAGLAAGDIDLRVENSTLTLRGERKLEREDKRDNYSRVERSYGTFARTFSLPGTVDAERVKADTKNGVLTVFLPRREEAKPRQIKVNVQ